MAAQVINFPDLGVRIHIKTIIDDSTGLTTDDCVVTIVSNQDLSSLHRETMSNHEVDSFISYVNRNREDGLQDILDSL
jgi:hypothetical protein